MRKPLLFVLPLLALLAPSAASAANSVTIAPDVDKVAVGASFAATLTVDSTPFTLSCRSGFEVITVGDDKKSFCGKQVAKGSYELGVQSDTAYSDPVTPFTNIGDAAVIVEPVGLDFASTSSVTTGQGVEIALSVTNPGKTALPPIKVSLGKLSKDTAAIARGGSVLVRFGLTAPTTVPATKPKLAASLPDDFGGATTSADLTVVAPEVTLVPTALSVTRGGTVGLEVGVENQSATPWTDSVAVKLAPPAGWASSKGTSFTFADEDASPTTTTLTVPGNAPLGFTPVTASSGGGTGSATVKVEAVVPPATPTPTPTPTVEPTPTPTTQPTPTPAPAPAPTPTAVLLAEPAPTPAAPEAHLKTLIYKRGGKLFQRYKAELVLGTSGLSKGVCKSAHLTLTAEGKSGSKWKRLASAKVDALISWEGKQKRCVIDTGFRFGPAMNGKQARFRFAGSFTSAGVLYKLDETALTRPRKGRPADDHLVVS